MPSIMQPHSDDPTVHASVSIIKLCNLQLDLMCVLKCKLCTFAYMHETYICCNIYTAIYIAALQRLNYILHMQ